MGFSRGLTEKLGPVVVKAMFLFFYFRIYFIYVKQLLREKREMESMSSLCLACYTTTPSPILIFIKESYFISGNTRAISRTHGRGRRRQQKLGK